jgi:hypothetical protein
MLSNWRHKILSWFRPEAVRPAVLCSGHYIAQHRGACSGAATSEAGEGRGLQVPGKVAEDVVGELGSVCVVVASIRVSMF